MTATPTPLRELPALPEAAYIDENEETLEREGFYSAEQMRAYAEAALSARDEAGAVECRERVIGYWNCGCPACRQRVAENTIATPPASGEAGACDCGARQTGEADQRRHSADCASYATPPAASGVIAEAIDALNSATAWVGFDSRRIPDLIRRLAAVAPAGMEWTGEVDCCDAKGMWLVLTDNCPMVPGQKVRILPTPPATAVDAAISALSIASDSPLLNRIAGAVRSTGHVTNTDKWEVAEAVMASLGAKVICYRLVMPASDCPPTTWTDGEPSHYMREYAEREGFLVECAYAYPAPGGVGDAVTEDKGPWRPGCDTADKWYVDSDDFTHDVRLYVTGDFAPGQREAYARALAETLNAALAARTGKGEANGR